VTDQGTSANVALQVSAVYQQLTNLPPNTPVRVTGLTEDAIRALQEVGINVQRIPGSKDVIVRADTSQANAALAALALAAARTVLTVAVRAVPGGNAIGNIVPKAQGGIMGYAAGGVNLRKMSANRAEIVKPNTWRVIGDRARDDEAYIPINQAARSRALLAETAKRMGYELFANGAIVGRSSTNQPGAGGITVAPGAIVVNSPYSDPDLVARATVNELARAAVS
jgi:hypothetical protein